MPNIYKYKFPFPLIPSDPLFSTTVVGVGDGRVQKLGRGVGIHLSNIFGMHC